MLILYFHIFQRGFEVLNAMFQTSVYVIIVSPIVYYTVPLYYICNTVRKFFDI